MTLRERTLAVLNYQDCRTMPLVHFGFWEETLEKWASEGHISLDEASNWADANEADFSVSAKLGFEGSWASGYSPNAFLSPPFEEKILERFDDGSYNRLDREGVIVRDSDANTSIPMEVDHLLKDREDWDKIYRPRMSFHNQRVTDSFASIDGQMLGWEQSLIALRNLGQRKYFTALNAGSLAGIIRNILGITGLSYLSVDDPVLLDEIFDTVGTLVFQVSEAVYDTGARFDIVHFWEDICYKSGPLVSPQLYREKAGPYYRKIADLAAGYGTRFLSVDCDGKIDALIPVWLENGVNVVFPIEVGTWNASMAPWRKEFGRELRGVGGMRKAVFAEGFEAVDREIERLKALVDLGGYIPCPDHRIPPDAEWDNVRYYCDRFRKAFG